MKKQAAEAKYRVKGEAESEEELEEKYVRVYIMGKEYMVPAGLTILKAMEYAGYRFIRGCGCRAGFCGACSTIYRLKNDYKLYTALACQTSVEDGMFLVQLPFTPANRSKYDLEKVKPTANTLLVYYPELARCVSCNTCTKACPQEIEVMDAVQAAIRGDIERVANLTFDCIQCGLCSIRCPAEIPQYHVFQMARRIYGKYIVKKARHVEERIKEIREGKYDEEMEELVASPPEKLKKLYKSLGRVE